MSYKYLRFFNKTGDYLNLDYDEAADMWSGSIDMGLISEGLIEDAQIYVTEQVFNTTTGTVEHAYPIGSSVCQGSIVIEGAGTTGVNGTYCQDGTFNGSPMWTKIGGTSTYDSIYVATLSPQHLWTITSGGSYAQNPLNVKYFALYADDNPPAVWTQASGGDDPPPTYGEPQDKFGTEWTVYFSPTGATEHFQYGFQTGPTAENWLVKERVKTYIIDARTYVTEGASGEYPGMKDVAACRSEALQLNIAFHPSREDRFENTLRIADQLGNVVCQLEVYGEGEDEDERLRAVLQTFGHDIAEADHILFDVQDINEPEADWLLLNRKRKELVHEYERIFPYIGSYRALINIIRYFGYTDVRLKEYWKNVDPRSRNFGKMRQTDIVEIFDKTANFRDSISVPSKIYRKTNLFGLFYDITRETGEFDDEGTPLVEETFTFSPEEVLIKMFALKNKLKRDFLPTNARIIDIVGEAIFFHRYDTVARIDQCRIDSVSLSTRPRFDVLPDSEVWMQDLRPLYDYGCPVGPNLTLDGQTDLLSWRVGIGNTAYVGGILDGIQTYRLVATIPGPTSYTVEARFERDVNTGQTAYSNFEIADGIIEAWRADAYLDENFVAYQEGGTSGVIRFVQRNPVGEGTIFASWFSNTTGVIPPGKFTLPGSTGGTADFINVSSGPSGTFGPSGAPLSYYGDCFLAYFNDINGGATYGLNDAEGIPVGCPVTLRNLTFDVSWEQAQVTYNQVDNTDFDQLGPTGGLLYESFDNSYTISGWTAIYAHPDLPEGATYVSIGVTAAVTGFPYASFPTQNFYSWINIGLYAYYEMRWVVTFDGDGFDWSHDSGRRPIGDINTYPLILPYEGEYTVELYLWDLYNTRATSIVHGAITVRMQEADVIGWYQYRALDYTWETRRLPVQSDFSRRYVDRSPRLAWDEYSSVWELPLHPNEEMSMADVTFNTIDSIEYYQTQTEEPVDRLEDRNPYYYNLVESSNARVKDMYHLWWDGVGTKVTQFEIDAAATGGTGYLYMALETNPYDISDPTMTVLWADGPTGWTGPVGVTATIGGTGDLVYSAYDSSTYRFDGASWLRVHAPMDGVAITGLGLQPTYREAIRELVRQLNDGLRDDPRDLPLLRSFIYYYDERYLPDYSLEPYVKAVSYGFDKHHRHRIHMSGMSGDSRSYETTYFGYLGDIPTHFEIYGVPATGPTGVGTIQVTGMTAAYAIGSTNLVDLAAELNGVTAQSDPVLGSYTYNLVLGYAGWSGGTGPTAYTEVKVQGVSDAFTRPHEIGVTYGGGVVGVVRGRSLIKNPSFDEMRVLKYAQELPLLSLVNFSYDNSRIYGKCNPEWRLTKELDGSFEDRYSHNRYFSYLFTERGSYTLRLSLEDTNGNKKEVIKQELIRIV